MTVFLTADQILTIHDQQAREFGGLLGVRSEPGLLSAIGQPQQSAFGEDAYPSVADKAAAYGFFIAENQPFLDGNKRTAADAMLTFLDLNGFEFDQTNDEIAEAFERLGDKSLDQAGFIAWVCGHARQR